MNNPQGKRQLTCKPGSVGPRCRDVVTIHLRRLLPDASCNQPGWSGLKTGWDRSPASSLFGLAPGGVYRAVSIAGHPVRSYRTLSPLPRHAGAVSFLWHFPWGRPRRPL